MRHESIDLGTVQMHKKVIGDIAAAALKEIPGVRLAGFGLVSVFSEMLGYKNFPGVTVGLDKDGMVHVKIRVTVDYGLNIPTVATHIQEAVRSAVERSVDIDLKEINVNIQSVERGVAACGA